MAFLHPSPEGGGWPSEARPGGGEFRYSSANLASAGRQSRIPTRSAFGRPPSPFGARNARAGGGMEQAALPGTKRMNVIADPSMIVVSGINVEVIERGRGRPLLFLHPEVGIERTAPVLDDLARGARVLVPSHPGFGRSELPRWMSTVDDLAYFYLDFLEALDLRDVTLVGVSFGGWIAAAIAVKSAERLSRLVLANPIGIKVADRETRDIVDVFALTDAEYN